MARSLISARSVTLAKDYETPARDFSPHEWDSKVVEQSNSWRFEIPVGPMDLDRLDRRDLRDNSVADI
jgi:hypothetical protein